MTTERFDKTFVKIIGWGGRGNNPIITTKEIINECFPGNDIKSPTLQANITFLRLLGQIIDGGKRWAKRGNKYEFFVQDAFKKIGYDGQDNTVEGFISRAASVSYNTGWERFCDYVLRKANDD